MLHVDVDTRAVQGQLAKLQKALAKDAMRFAVRRAVNAGKTAAVKEIAEAVTLKHSRIKAAMKVYVRADSGELVIQGGPVGLVNFQARQVATGVSVQVKRRGGRKTVVHAFIRTKSGKQHVFTREEDGQGGRSPRLPVRRLFSVAVEQEADEPRVVEAVTVSMHDTLLKRIDHEVQRALT